jgi:polysaccharide biosynthesis transport protein
MHEGLGPIFIENSDDIDHARTSQILWRRRWLILSVTVLFLVVVGAVVSVMPRHYVAQALVLVGHRGDLVPYGPSAGSSAAATPRIDPEAVQTEIEMLQSPALAERVVHQLHLDKRSEFKLSGVPNSAGKTADTKTAAATIASEAQGAISWLRQLYGEALSSISGGKPAANDPNRNLSRLVARFLSHLEVNVKGQSRVIAVQFDSEDPALAATVVNTLVQDYQNDQVQSRLEAAKESELWLHKRISELRKKVANSELAIANFQATHHLYSGPGGTSLGITQLIDANNELEHAREARISVAGTGLRRADGGEVSLSMSNSQALENLRAQEGNVSAMIAAASTQLGDQNPKLQRLRAQLSEINNQIARERSLVARSSARSSAARRRRAQASERDFEANLQRIQAEIAETSGSRVQLQELQREAAANRSVLQSLLVRSIAEMPEGAAPTATQIVSQADVPTSPSKPQKSLLLLIGAFCGIVFSCALAIILEKRKVGFRTFEELELETREVCLGGLPSDAAVRRSPVAIARDVGSVYQASITAVYTKLLLQLGSKSKVIFITSALPQEGKTTLALSLAALAGHGDHRTVLIDLDFWRRGASSELGFGNGPGIADLLERRSRFGDVIVSDLGANIDVIRPGVLSEGYDLTRDDELVRLIEYLTRSYEFVIIDSPPVLAVSQILVLAAYADATILAARWDHTNRDVVKLALKRLRDAGASIGGVVLTMIDQRQLLKLGGANATYFSKDLTSYYARRPELPDGRVETETSHPEARLSRRGRIARSLVRMVLRHRSPQRLIPLYQDPGTALLVVDVQKDLVSWSARHGLKASLQDPFFDVVNNVCDIAAKRGVMIIYVRQEFQSFGPRFVSRFFVDGVGAKGSPDNDLDHRVNVLADRNFSKPSSDVFSNEDLELILRQHKIDQLCLVGVDVLGSIEDTARSAIARGFRVAFVRDGIVSTSQAAKDRLLKQWESQSAFWMTSKQFQERMEMKSRADIAADPTPSLMPYGDTNITGMEPHFG